MAQDIRDKIAKLLALADSPSEAEAKAALLKARELMAKHKLRPEEIKKAENVKVIKETIGWKPERNLSHMIWDAYQWHRDHPDGYGDKKQPGRW